MRNTFSRSLTKLARQDDSIILIVGDIGFGVFDEFLDEFPNRFINAGVAEANMIGTAAGLAAVGMTPIVYTIIPFLVMRTFEQIRNDICMQKLPVTLVGVGGGLSYGTLGPTHHALEDISIMRTLPNMRVISPSEPREVEWCFENIMNDPSPTYLRLGKGGEEKILTDKNINDNKFSEPLKIMNGTDVSIISSGYILKEAIETAEILNNKGISCSVINLHQLKPVSKKIYDLVKKSSLVVSIEEHSIIGGVGDLVNACINENNECPPLIKIGINDKFVNTIGDRDFLLDLNDLTPTKMSNLIFKKIKNL